MEPTMESLTNRLSQPKVQGTSSETEEKLTKLTDPRSPAARREATLLADNISTLPTCRLIYKKVAENRVFERSRRFFQPRHSFILKYGNEIALQMATTNFGLFKTDDLTIETRIGFKKLQHEDNPTITPSSDNWNVYLRRTIGSTVKWQGSCSREVLIWLINRSQTIYSISHQIRFTRRFRNFY